MQRSINSFLRFVFIRLNWIEFVLDWIELTIVRVCRPAAHSRTPTEISGIKNNLPVFVYPILPSSSPNNLLYHSRSRSHSRHQRVLLPDVRRFRGAGVDDGLRDAGGHRKSDPELWADAVPTPHGATSAQELSDALGKNIERKSWKRSDIVLEQG